MIEVWYRRKTRSKRGKKIRIKIRYMENEGTAERGRRGKGWTEGKGRREKKRR